MSTDRFSKTRQESIIKESQQCSQGKKSEKKWVKKCKNGQDSKNKFPITLIIWTKLVQNPALMQIYQILSVSGVS